MIVNRVFCYSKDVAKKNGIRLPILELVLLTVVFIVWFIVSAMMFYSRVASNISMIIFVTLVIYYSVLLGIRMRNRMIAYATDTNGRIFKAMAVNNGQGLYFGGLAAGGTIDQLAGSDSGIGKSLGGTVGAAAQFYSMNRSAKYMSRPEIVAKMVESAPNITGAEVYEILKVYSITDKGKTVKVNCDYKILSTNKIRYAKNLTIEKAFNMFDDLISVLNTHR